MARNSDHELRDAQHRIRAELSLELARYQRRMLETAYAYAVEAIAQANKEGKDFDATEIGRAAAEKAKANYFATNKPEPAIETSAVERHDKTDHSIGTGGAIVSTRTDRSTDHY